MYTEQAGLRFDYASMAMLLIRVQFVLFNLFSMVKADFVGLGISNRL